MEVHTYTPAVTLTSVSHNTSILLQAFVDPFSNFTTYRQALETAIGQASKNKEKTCVVPFFSLLVKDIYFLNEGMTNRLLHRYMYNIIPCIAVCVNDYTVHKNVHSMYLPCTLPVSVYMSNTRTVHERFSEWQPFQIKGRVLNSTAPPVLRMHPLFVNVSNQNTITLGITAVTLISINTMCPCSNTWYATC